MTNRTGTANAVSFTATNPTITFSGAVTSGDLLILADRSADESITISDVTDNVNSGGWTLLLGPSDHSNTALRGWIYYKIANANGTPTVTVSGSGSHSGHLAVACFQPESGQTIAHDASGTTRTNSASSDTTHTSNNVVATAAGGVVSALLTSGTVTTTPATGETNVTNASTRAHIHFEQHAVSGTYAHQTSTSAGTHSMHFITAFKDAVEEEEERRKGRRTRRRFETDDTEELLEIIAVCLAFLNTCPSRRTNSKN